MNWSKLAFWVCLSISASLIVAGFILPPMGIIDGSVLTATGELLGFAALGFATKAVHDGMNLKFTHGLTTVEIDKDDDNDDKVKPDTEEVL